MGIELRSFELDVKEFMERRLAELRAETDEDPSEPGHVLRLFCAFLGGLCDLGLPAVAFQHLMLFSAQAECDTREEFELLTQAVVLLPGAGDSLSGLLAADAEEN